ncbi:hypothetical protein B0O99DRAFT_327082 [Bisporella sp. PMI_857]|nr:hypothetical protein B0O99DRAFT_365867 [Bisporella sp. PMI_857]KAH8600480.1 hypothetical protein B0O99DRAFT_327082 [Bisporella sp. PMI_857]
MTAIYVIARIKKIDLFAFFRNREFRRGGDRGWYGWRSKLTPYYPSSASFTSFTYVSDEKPILPSPQPIATTIPTATALSPVSPVSPMSVVFPVLHVVNPEAHLSQNPVPPQDVAFSPQRNPAPFAVSAASKRQEQNPPSADATYPAAQKFMNNNMYQLNLENYSNTYNTNTTFTSSNAYDPAQREVNHLSYLSSLSSGFGDGQILIPRATTELDDPTGSAGDQSRKFSWVSSSRMRDRDTTYTTASVESTPHFRTVNSWVAQQAGRAERHQQVNTDVPAVPDIPLPLKINSDHQRNLSEMTAFKQHPGNEIELQKGKRIPSEILDKKTGIN